MSKHTLVLGDGGWGQALAMSLHRAGRPVVVWAHEAAYAAEVAETRHNRKFLPDVPVPDEIGWTGDEDVAVDGADEVYSVLPTQFVRATVGRFGDRLRGLPIVSASKGLERGTLKRPTQILAEAVGGEPAMCVVTGPSHAEETALGMATTVVAAAPVAADARRVQERLSSEALRVYTGEDMVGAELGGALKNIIALAAGVADGIGLGDNAKAALVSRGLIEMARFGESLGSRRETFFGLSGVGDLMVTCYSRHSRNRSTGEQIGRGRTLKEILAETEKVAEGVWTCQAIHEAASEQGVDMPITHALHGILFDGADPRDVVGQLMQRPSRAELDRDPA